MEHGSGAKDPVADRSYPYINYYAVTTRLREGILSSGEQYKPFPWLENNTIPKSKQQVTIERAMESCTFKSLLSCVMGVLSYCENCMIMHTHLQYKNRDIVICRVWTGSSIWSDHIRTRPYHSWWCWPTIQIKHKGNTEGDGKTKWLLCQELCYVWCNVFWYRMSNRECKLQWAELHVIVSQCNPLASR